MLPKESATRVWSSTACHIHFKAQQQRAVTIFACCDRTERPFVNRHRYWFLNFSTNIVLPLTLTATYSSFDISQISCCSVSCCYGFRENMPASILCYQQYIAPRERGAFITQGKKKISFLTVSLGAVFII